MNICSKAIAVFLALMTISTVSSDFAVASADCAALFSPTPDVAFGLRLNPEQLARALNDGTTQVETETLLQAARAVAKLSAHDLVRLSEISVETSAAEGTTSGAGSPLADVPPLAHLLISQAMKDLNKNKTGGWIPAPLSAEKGLRRIREFLRDLATERELPDFESFIIENPRLLAFEAGKFWFGRDGRAKEVILDSKTELELMAFEDRAFAKLEEVNREGTATLKDLVLAMAHFEPGDNRVQLESALRRTFNIENRLQTQYWDVPSFLLHNKKSTREMAWQHGGFMILNFMALRLAFHVEFFRERETGIETPQSALSAVVTRPDAIAFVARYIPDQSSPAFEMVLNAMMRALRPKRDLVIDPNIISQHLAQALQRSGQNIRAKLKALDAEAARQQPPRPLPHYQTAPLQSRGIRLASVQGNLLKNNAAPVARDLKSQEPLKIETESVKQLRSLFQESVDPSQRYAFRFRDMKEDAYVVFSERLLEDLAAKRIELKPWVSDFLIGFTSKKGMSGVKRVTGTPDLWEIKNLRSSFRIVIRQDKKTKTWHWSSLRSHGNVMVE